jgi:16S rRNA (cytosine967-C5)-methyltransferase
MLLGKQKAISPARRLALEVLRRVEAEGAFATLAIEHALERHPQLSAEDRGLITQLVYGSIRWRRRLDFALAAHCHRPLERIEPVLLRILRMTAFQLLFLERVPDYAAVDEATQMALVQRGKHASGFVNAVLRQLAQNTEAIEWPDPLQDRVHALGVLHSFPDWMVQWWDRLLGPERLEAFLKACNQPAALWVRANTLRTKAEALVELLTASGMPARASKVVPDALQFTDPGDIRALAAHEAGLFHVQDAAAQAVCHLLAPRPGERVLDACAAPGGKTATLAELMQNQGELVAVDVHPARLGLVRKLAERLGATCIRCQAGDLTELGEAQLGTFDRILLDAPCSALGVLRRHPEGKWRLVHADVERLAGVQRGLLERAALLLKPGGHLVYSVCTFTEEEGTAQVAGLLQDHPELELIDPREGKRLPWHALVDASHFLRTWPQEHDADAFFAVRLRRRA